jgi:phosphoribosylcarboxyaminoimidazole (NCAIR) mutase
MVFDPNCKNIAAMFLARVHNGQIDYRRTTMGKPYARVGENGASYNGPPTPSQSAGDVQIGVFGPHADEKVRAPEILQLLSALNGAGKHISLVAIPSETSWGKASSDLVKAVYDDRVLALITLDRASSHLAEQIAVKAFVPVLAISSDRMLTSTNIPWIFRVPQGTPVQEAVRCLSAAIDQSGPNRVEIRKLLASGEPVAGVRFDPAGERQ